MPIHPTSTPDLLIALNAAPDLPREAICSLAADLVERQEEAWPSTVRDVARRTGVAGSRVKAAFAAYREAERIAGRQRRRAERLGVAIVTACDPEYPQALRDLPLPPPVVHLKGRFVDRPGVSVVGSRDADPYGLEAADLFGRELARAGLTVTSGLARGIDGAAHRGALEGNGETLAVLACGLDSVYPRAHVGLSREIVASGSLISEFPFDCPPLRHHFPIRNRLIAALGLGTLVVQATVRSGSLITAGHALELGRQIWAVPGSIFDRRSAGTNRLIRDGAAPALSPADILEGLPQATRDRLAPTTPGDPPPAEGAAASVLSALSVGRPQAAEAIAAAAGLDVGATLAALCELELSSFVRRYPGPAFTRRAC